MKVSIIIPVYNVERYIERCIVSVMEQTYTNLECIIVDDGSTDSSLDVCQKTIGNYEGKIVFHIIRHKEALGPSDARNTGADAATGDYIFYMDSDDEITKDCITVLVHKAIEYPEAEIVQGQAWAERNQSYYSLDRYNGIELIDGNKWICQEFFQVDNAFPVDVWNKLIRRDFLMKNQIFFKSGIIHEDQLWSYEVTKVLKKMCFVHKVTYKHYSVPHSIMTSLSRQRSNHSWRIILEDIVPKMSKPFLNLQIRKYLLEYLERFGEGNEETVRILAQFKGKALQALNFKLAFALWLFDYTHGASLKQWLLMYCRTSCTKGLSREIYYDCASRFSIMTKAVFRGNE